MRTVAFTLTFLSAFPLSTLSTQAHPSIERSRGTSVTAPLVTADELVGRFLDSDDDTVQVQGEAQSVEPPSQVCWARARERCTITVVTSAGVYLGVTRRTVYVGGDPVFLRAVADWGVLKRVGARDHIGASLFASFDSNDELLVGPAFWYRREIGSMGILDFALGAPVFTTEGAVDKGTSLLAPWGLVKWSPSRWVGVAVRPEIRRGLSDFEPSRFVVSFGVEVGGVTGFLLTVLGGLAGTWAFYAQD